VTAALSQVRKREFFITILGRTLEHLGVQMYKRRDVAIAELVANSWDAGATVVNIVVPGKSAYNAASSRITISDNGSGMNDDEVQEQYLVVGRNRRSGGGNIAAVSSATEGSDPRPVMGRKGIGKLAGFGIATEMTVSTRQSGESTTFMLDLDQGAERLLGAGGRR
jgi:HSP90 family molecular chaperone